ncbi:MAG: hypothetical protein WC438_01550 [Candidatus Pacearchaeota archaeon]
MAKIIQDIKPRGIASAYVDAPFDKGKTELEANNYHIISLEENANLRMQEGKDAYVSRNGNWTREGVLYVPDKGIFLTKNSPIMTNAKEATNCHRKGKEFYLTNEQIEEALADSIELKAENIPTNRFGENSTAVYAFGDSAKQYGEFLKDTGIKEMPVCLVNLETKPFARQMWFRYLDCKSELCGYKDLGFDIGVRGVGSGSVEGTQKNSEAYTPKQISNGLKKLGFTGLEKTLIETLKQEA